jgi:hypothetical protein
MGELLSLRLAERGRLRLEPASGCWRWCQNGALEQACQPALARDSKALAPGRLAEHELHGFARSGKTPG